MLEGSFRPASSAAGPHHQFPINPKSGYPDQASPVVNMRKDHSGPSFTPVHDRPASSHSPDYESEDHQQLGSPPGQPPHYFKNHPSLANQSQSNQSLVVHQDGSEVSQSPSMPNLEARPSQESVPKNSSIGPVRAKKKPAGSACNSCHRLKVRSRSGPKAGRKFPTPSGATAGSQPGTSAPMPPMSLPQVTQLSAPSVSTLSAPIAPQPSPLSVVSSKQETKSTPHISTSQPPEAYGNYEPNLSHSSSLHVRLAALENSVSGLLQVLRAQQSSNHSFHASPSEQRPPLSPPTPPTLVVSGSSSTFGPEKDHPNDPNRLGSPNTSSGLGDPLSEGIISAPQLQYLYDVVLPAQLADLACCQISLNPCSIILLVQRHGGYRRSFLLFTVYRSHTPENCMMSNSTGTRVDLSQVTIDDATYARLVALAHQHLSATLLKANHNIEDVRAILFLACWALVSNEDPSGAPHRWVLIGHAGRIGRSIGLDRCAAELRGSNGIWNNPELHATRRSQLDAIKTDHALQAIETILSSNLRLEPSRGYFPPLSLPAERDPSFTIAKLSKGSPFQYDVVSAAQIESLAELAEIWASANSFLSVADDRSRNISSDQLIELGEHHNKVMDAWAKKWTWHGSSWAPLLGANLRTIRLLSESLRITLNLAFTNVLYAIAAVSRLSPKLHETLAMAIERVNGSSTAVIQAHRDSVREGYSLAFAPDLVTDGLVSAAITVLQLASPIGLPSVMGKANGRESKKQTPHPSGSTSNLEAPAREERLPTPHLAEDRADVDMTEANASNSNGIQSHLLKGPPHGSRASSPASNSRRHSKSTSPHVASFPVDVGAGNQTLGKKCFMEPPVAAHYIRMATDVLQSSDRSQTRLGTIMASKIMRLATQAGLMGPTGASSLMGPISNTTQSPSSCAVNQDERTSISSTTSLTSTRLARKSSGENPDVNHQGNSTHEVGNGSDGRATDNSNPEISIRHTEDEDDDSNEHNPTSSQLVTENVKPASPAHNVQEDEHEDQTVEEVADGDCEADGDGDGDGEGEGYEEDQIGGDSNSIIHHEQGRAEKDGQDMMEEYH
ncbi:hypothetical protein H4Q26_018246 [Puccinia striiformis f. sp. tritici PST-130]|nr:hypothetical protein H4Q26_018246 [Puccinia striiformis f. sp. tritici PST-130]